ncbi:MAG: ATP-dependent DNA helicase RecG [Candidatus Levybacteria bacterium]|nr:ATP-dependent DNA helicase RecG [Candidatus Levybacteria bacterium]
MDLQTPIQKAGRIYTRYLRQFEKLGIKKLEDLLFHIPSRYEDYSIISKINQVQQGEIVTILGKVVNIKNDYTRRIRLQKAQVADDTGIIDVTWFNQIFLTKVIHEEDNISLSGKIGIFNRKPYMESPEYELLRQDNTQYTAIHTGRLVPIYPETKGLSSKWLRRQIYKILQERKNNLLEYIPYSIIKNNNFMEIYDAIEQIHFPKSKDIVNKARLRLAFDELFLLQLAAISRRNEWEKKLTGTPFSITKFSKKIEEFWSKLPFELTNAQKRAVKDIFADLAYSRPMNRLLEGDVGSGKTVVSAITMYVTCLNGYQSVLMAPTEILAQQHYQTINNLLSPLGVKVELVTGSNKSQVNNQKGENWKFDILIGTHAVLSDKINFEKLGLVVIDEQQRFGVEQRTLIRKKGNNPHLLTMTATPIPRTIALTLYGDLDLSYLDEMPKGRREIKTWLVPPVKRENAYRWIEKQILETKSQAFIICPFIEESESMQTIKAATKEFDRLKNTEFKNLRLGLLHGKIKAKEKDDVLMRFRNGEFDILVTTPVVEVGIDIPNATIMLIEAADRFGLAQLHQLRGRVGRGDKQSYCLLFTESTSNHSLQRLKAMETLHVGAKLAELDLKLRGPGEMYGTMQHGMAQLKVANFSDISLIEKARLEAEKIFPKLSQYSKLLEKLQTITIKQVSPD